VLALNIYSPVEGQKISVLTFTANGQVTPPTAEVRIQGRTVPVTAAGTFSGLVTITEEEGTQQIDFEAIAGDKTMTVSRGVVYQAPPDLLKPSIQGSLPAFSVARQLMFTVIDRTVNDEIKFYREIDGSRESETGAPHGRFYLNLLDGLHDYAVYAVDKQGNQSQRLTGKVTYLARQLTIRLRNPISGSNVLRLPPSGTPDADYAPVYTVSFTLEGLPDDDPNTLRSVVKEVRVTNRTTGKSDALTSITDNDLDFEVALKKGALNAIEIRVTDIRNVVSLATVSILVR
jgi:hypothetical protein